MTDQRRGQQHDNRTESERKTAGKPDRDREEDSRIAGQSQRGGQQDSRTESERRTIGKQDRVRGRIAGQSLGWDAWDA